MSLDSPYPATTSGAAAGKLKEGPEFTTAAFGTSSNLASGISIIGFLIPFFLNFPYGGRES